MPTLSMFFGLIIEMYYAPKEHHPPHIHVRYQGDKASVNKLDMKPYLDFGPVFRALKEPSMFNSVRVYFDSVSWANEADLDPEILYPNSVLV